MLVFPVFLVSLVVFGIDGRSTSMDKAVSLPCKFETYDINSDEEISVEEFLSATKGFTKMDPKALFKRLDKDGDQTIRVDEFTHADRGLEDTGILDHCKRLRCSWWCTYISGKR
eukprot:XP_011451837.1 PREDICTED: uncharacterized protein LOC105345404 [Crassostrea gigas]